MKTITSLPNADIVFMNWNRDKKRELIVRWVGLRDAFLGKHTNIFPEVLFRYFGLFMFGMLSDCWDFSLMEGNVFSWRCPRIASPASTHVLLCIMLPSGHYTSCCWCGLAKGEQPFYEWFVRQHSIGEETAQENNMPIYLVLK